MALDFGWGGEAWGEDEWGSGDAGAFELLAVTPVRENVVRLGFSNPVYFSSLRDTGDASDPTHYVTEADTDTSGLDGLPTRPVNVLEVVLADFDGAGGFFVDVILDRAMSPWPGLYSITVDGIRDINGTPITTTTFFFFGLFRSLVAPSVDKVIPSRDLGNQAAVTPVAGAPEAFTVDTSGDYAFDEGLPNLKKRIFRRGITEPGAFAHLPGYGVGIPSYGKRLTTVAVRNRLAAEYERQVLQEPEVEQATVVAVTDPNSPSITRFVVRVKTRGNQQLKFSIPFDSNA